MRHERIVALTAMLGMLWAGCGGSSSAPSAPTTAAAGSFLSSHFLFQYTTLDADNIGTIAGAVESVYPRIIAELLSDALPQVNVTFYLDHSALETADWAAAGVVVPTWASGLATAENRIHLMSPNLRSWGLVLGKRRHLNVFDNTSSTTSGILLASSSSPGGGRRLCTFDCRQWRHERGTRPLPTGVRTAVVCLRPGPVRPLKS